MMSEEIVVKVCLTIVYTVDMDVDVEDLRAQANASIPASYIANY